MKDYSERFLQITPKNMRLKTPSLAPNNIPVEHSFDETPQDPHDGPAELAGPLPTVQAQPTPQPMLVRDVVCPDYDTLPAVQVAPPLHPHQELPGVPPNR